MRRGLVYGASAVERRRFGEGGESGGAKGAGRSMGMDGAVSWRGEEVECKVAYGQVAVKDRKGMRERSLYFWTYCLHMFIELSSEKKIVKGLMVPWKHPGNPEGSPK